eukprot:TRINITY_DN6133_c0_g1_i1.p2 TRINITY_DN6133_c0_g1~~TRINITY_DN6133_c0_g1_i1.p2  ORF type:complete len:307 (+),score=84.52 TRINITY_DN6133_c0_g1_i1:132-1052(+)
MDDQLLNRVKDALTRRKLFAEMKDKRAQLRYLKRKTRKKLVAKYGEDSVPKGRTKTMENTHVADETTVQHDDEEVRIDIDEDEWQSYFHGEQSPKVLVASVTRPGGTTRLFMRELGRIWPDHCTLYDRRSYRIRDIAQYAIKAGFTDLLIVQEMHRQPYLLIASHLPVGPTAVFRISSYVPRKKMEKLFKTPPAPASDHNPELNFKNFTTRLGLRVQRLLHALFPAAPEYEGRAIATFHNQRDFLFFRLHRYIFESLESVRIQEIGPRFTLKIKAMQHGLFDRQFGEYEWMLHKREMAKTRKEWFL